MSRILVLIGTHLAVALLAGGIAGTAGYYMGQMDGVRGWVSNPSTFGDALDGARARLLHDRECRFKLTPAEVEACRREGPR